MAEHALAKEDALEYPYLPMTSDTLTLPPLLIPQLTRGRTGHQRSRSHPDILPADLEDRLEHIAREAMRLGVDPILAAAKKVSKEEAESLAERGFDAFLTTRRQIWPLLAGFIAAHPLVLLQLLGEVNKLVKAKRLEIPLPSLEKDEGGRQALLRLDLALQTYEMTMALCLRSVPSVIRAVVLHGEPPELADPSTRDALLVQLDTSTARLEYGTILGIHFLEHPKGGTGSTFALATQYAAKGADEQHVLLRGLLRRIIGEEPEGPPANESGDVFVGDVPPEVLVAEWVRAALAA